MIQFSVHNIIHFTSLLVYIVLISLVLYSQQTRIKRLLVLFLVAGAGVCISSILTNLQIPYEQLIIWQTLIPLFTTWSIVTYLHFISASYGHDTGKIAHLGYAWLVLTGTYIVSINLAQGLVFVNNEVISQYLAAAIDALVYVNMLVVALVGFFLFSRLQEAALPEDRSRASYLMFGLGTIMAAIAIGVISRNGSYSYYNIGYTINAILITYTLVRYRILDIRIHVKRWIVYTSLTIGITIGFLMLLLGLSKSLRLLPANMGTLATIAMIMVFAVLFNWIKSALDKSTDRLFYEKRNSHRQLLLNFTNKMSGFLTTKEIANALIGPLAGAVQARQVGLLLPMKRGYVTKYVVKLDESDEVFSLVLQHQSKLKEWMASQRKPILRQNLQKDSRFTWLSETDRQALQTAHAEVLCPIIDKGQLFGIIMLSEKYPQGNYNRDDIELIRTLARESAVAFENAQIYVRERDKAGTDDLTGLNNHRYFQESLAKAVENSAVSGADFALLFIDLDLFETYNDIYGYSLGDELLIDLGRLIRNTIRDTDIGARYGGDEFACLLHQTDAVGARKVAERIRRKMEKYSEKKGVTVTCSIGVAGWRVDGVTKEKIIEAADRALLYAKRSGGNRTTLASNLDKTEPLKPEVIPYTRGSQAIENIVFALAATVDARDHYTFGHSRAVSQYAVELARELGYSAEKVQTIRSAGLLHDIGKLNLPDSILTKRDPLTDAEWDMIRYHPELGTRILKYIPGLRDCMDVVLYHHERYDGNGYPSGLRGEEIPKDARIMAIADSYDAMISERGYKRRKLTKKEAIEELEACSGTQFDPELVNIFIKIRKKSVTPEIELDNILETSHPGEKKKPGK
jgi:diguanylate cyclase (GGDEF)-like protein/putative nucleotidyltransferase with HDIG domain